MNNPILSVDHLSKIFVLHRTFLGGAAASVKAIDSVSFSIFPGETFGLVGETGCGKSTLARTIAGLYQPTDGKVLFKGHNLHAPQEKHNSIVFKRQIQMIFQDPYASLNPRMTIRDIIEEPLSIHKLAKGKEKEARISSLLHQVGLNAEYGSRFPHECSGGQRQRVGIARALAVNPELIICDEPISALDVSIQAQVINLLEQLQTELGLTYLFIAHDLSMVRHISTRVAVMYLGSLVELAPTEELYSQPLHPYTQALLSAIPIPDPAIEAHRNRILLPGDIPSPLDPPSGCKFHNRCRYAMPICQKISPELTATDLNHYTACHLVK